MVSRRSFLVLGAAAAGLAAAGGGVAVAYHRAISRAEDRIATGSQTIRTSFGTMEYAVEGDGRPLLMIHGTGGGFDQGLSFCRRLLPMGHRVVSPSRFGYLRSDFPSDAGTANQADQFTELLDVLGIDRLPVVGGSAGALPAIEFAIRHPDRCSGLVALVPAAFAPERPSLRPMSATQEEAMRAMLGSDFLFWAAMHVARDQMFSTMLATDPRIIAAASPTERERAERILREILPVSRRSRGLMNDARLAANPARQALDRIKVPTLAISVEDDRFGTADAARYIAAQVPGAKLVIYPSGGHIWIGHDKDVFAEVDAFVKSLA